MAWAPSEKKKSKYPPWRDFLTKAEAKEMAKLKLDKAKIDMVRASVNFKYLKIQNRAAGRA